jgi:hypothetical protein
MFGRRKGTPTKSTGAGAGKKKTPKPASKRKKRTRAGVKKKSSVKKVPTKSSSAGAGGKSKSGTKASAKKTTRRGSRKGAAGSTTAKTASKKAAQRKRVPAKKAKPGGKSTVSKKNTSAKKKTGARAGKTTSKKKTPVKKSTSQRTAARQKPVTTAAKGSKSKGTGTVKSPLKVSARKKTAAKPVQKKISPQKVGGSGHVPPIKPPFEAYKGIRSYLFTSYAHHDMKTVFSIIKKLNKKRYRIWYDEGIEPGNEWPEIVGKAIVNCTQFLVLMSPHAAVSRNVRNEINLAFTEDKNILVVFLKKTKLTEGMKLQIGTVQFINKFEISEREFLEKIDKVLDSNMKN